MKPETPISVAPRAAPCHETRANLLCCVFAGVYWATPAAVSPLFDAWLAQGATTLKPMEDDQVCLNRGAYDSWAPCEDISTCLVAARRGMTPVWRSPSLYDGGGSCAGRAEFLRDGWHCAPRLSFFHILCVTGWDSKREYWDRTGLWLIDEGGKVIPNSTVLQQCGRFGFGPAREWTLRVL